MIIDAKLTLSEDQAVTATAISENVIAWPDTGTVHGEAAAMSRDLGAGNPLPIMIQVTEDFATATSVTISIESDSVAGLSSSPTVHATTGAIPIATLVAGYKIPIRFVPDGTMGKYLGLRYTIGGSNATAGKFSAAVATERDTGQ